ncbi:hypothetical protein ITJ44_13935 [Clavibacter sp. VKM Ac-2873]|uniref:hypothetical protein n=1 Tax=Clavibacter sp. VKM Ac-2873 TaxID=2783813 RepID=UPI00188AF1E2|nr:hypothetical protein [Clavibacter sp. VKM Ac-2873]MBF4619174.1 hypothetical protein [Clavibacter sp. VKM Ac-2873]
MFEPQMDDAAATKPIVEDGGGGAEPVAAATAYPFRLLPDETVLATYPVARRTRPLGRLVSYLFVTDSRVIYSAEAKTVSSSSTYSREYKIDKVDGIEVSRDTGYDALGVAALAGTAINLLVSLIAWLVLVGADSSSLDGLAWLFGVGTFFALVLGVIGFFVLRSRAAVLSVITGSQRQEITTRHDVAKILFVLVLFVALGPIAVLGAALWVLARELGIVSASNAGLYIRPDDLERISFEAGALILDAQARGKLAGTWD